ncbi:hypothetical protein CGRA01v4_03604 [Colletotrichum graminicola]|nr:hypothetical protein CGRA01v4_03604 [Colletotrichum graminicola]
MRVTVRVRAFRRLREQLLPQRGQVDFEFPRWWKRTPLAKNTPQIFRVSEQQECSHHRGSFTAVLTTGEHRRGSTMANKVGPIPNGEMCSYILNKLMCVVYLTSPVSSSGSEGG